MFRNYLLFFVSVVTVSLLASCSSIDGTRTVSNAPVRPTSFMTQTPLTASVNITPTIPTSSPEIINTATKTASPPASVTPRWKKYEAALVKAFLPQGYSGVCEWTILGQSKEEVYLWALCKSSPTGPAMSGPAVIVLDPNGDIQRVKVPGDGAAYSRDVRKFFPPGVQKKVFGFYTTPSMHTALGSKEYFNKRFSNPDLPPRIVILGTPLP